MNIETGKKDLSTRGKELLEFALKADHGSPAYKIRHFVGDAQITKYAKYRQFVLELRAREDSLESTLISIELQKAKIARLKSLYEISPPIDKEVLHWEIVEAEVQLERITQRISLAYSERQRYIDALEEMYESGDAYLEDGTDIKETFTNPELQEKMEAEHWMYRLGKQAALDLVTYNHIGTGNLEAISMMGQEDAIKTLILALTYSHGVKSALGSLEQSVLKEIQNGLSPTLSIEDTKISGELNA